MTSASPASAANGNTHHKTSNGHLNNHAPQSPPPKVAVFWDFENCPPPSGMPGYVVVENIRNVTHHFGDITLFKAYLEISDISPNKKSLRSELQSSGVSLTDCPHNGRKDAADKMMMVDMLAFAIDHPPPATIVIISGDRDFVYAISTLRNRRYGIVLIVPNSGAPIILKSQANAILEWRYDILNQDVWSTQQQQKHNLSSAQSLFSNILTSASPRDQQQQPQAANYVTSSLKTSPSEEQKTGLAAAARPLSAGNSGHDASKQSTKQPTRATQPNSNNSGNNTISATPSALRVATQPRVPSLLSSSAAVTAANNNNTENPSDIPDDEEAKKFANEYVGFVFSPKAPGYFDLLIEVMEKFRLANEPKPRRSRVGNELLRRNPLLYHRAGCSSFKEYIELAVKEGIVSIGGDKGLAWVCLNEDISGKVFVSN